MNDNSIIKNLKSDLTLLLLPSIALAALFTLIKITGSNRDLFLDLNQISLYTTKYLWVFFTFWGDSLASAILLIPFIRKRPDILWAGLIGATICGLIVFFMKQSLGINRPTMVFSSDEFIHIGRMVKYRSFPSGHTATAFWLAGNIAFSFRNRNISIIALIVAALIGFSRIAVGVHWPLDVTTGAIIGWICAYVGHFIYGMFIRKDMIRAVRVFMILLTILAFYTSFFYNCHYQRALSTKIVGGMLLALWGVRETIVMFKNSNKVMDE